MTPILTVIVPAYNLADRLPRCLAGLDGVVGVEVVVVNDGSTDSTLAVAQEFARRARCAAVRVLDKPNGHYGSCVNAGLAAASGVYVKTVDADDAVDAAGFARLVDFLRAADGADVVVSDFAETDDRGEILNCTRYDLPTDDAFGFAALARLDERVVMHAITYRTARLREIGYRQSEGIAYTDNEWATLPLLHVKRARYLPATVYLYTTGRAGQSMSPASRAARRGDFAVVALRFLAAERQAGPNVDAEARAYLHAQLVRTAAIYAGTVLCTQSTRAARREIAAFVEKIGGSSSRLFGEIERDLVIFRHGFPFAYFRLWRRLPLGKGLLMALVRLYLRHAGAWRRRRPAVRRGTSTRPIRLYLTPYFPAPECWRGGFSYDAVRALQREGACDVRVVVAGKCDDEYEYGGVHVVRFRFRRGFFGAFPWLFAHGNARRFFAAAARAGALEARVVQANTPVCAPLAAAFKRRHPAARGEVQFHQGRPLEFLCGRLGFVPVLSHLLARHLRRGIAAMDRLVFVSEVQRQRYEASEGPVEPSRCEIRPNPVDEELFCAGPRGEHAGFVIGCVANFIACKGQDVLLRALARVPGVCVRFVGSGPTRAACRTLTRKLGLDARVSFETEMDHRRLPEFYRAIDLLVLPSREEAFGSVCAEAQACGTPVVCGADAGFAETLDPETRAAFTFPPGDAAALAAVLRRLSERTCGRPAAGNGNLPPCPPQCSNHPL